MIYLFKIFIVCKILNYPALMEGAVETMKHFNCLIMRFLAGADRINSLTVKTRPDADIQSIMEPSQYDSSTNLNLAFQVNRGNIKSSCPTPEYARQQMPLQNRIKAVPVTGRESP
jgi:hypothetical protein